MWSARPAFTAKVENCFRAAGCDECVSSNVSTKVTDENSDEQEVRVLELSELQSRPPREALAFWQMKAGSADMPPVAAIDPGQLKNILPHVVLIDVIWPDSAKGDPEPDDFCFRLIGQHSVDAHGANVTGMMVSTLSEFGPEYARLGMAFYRFVCAKKRPIAVRGPLKMIGKDYRQFEAVYLPFCGDKGRVDRIMAAINYT